MATFPSDCSLLGEQSQPDGLQSTKVSTVQKQVIISHLKDWMRTLEQQNKSICLPQDVVPIIHSGIENQKQHLLLVMDRLGYLESKANVIHALQEASEALGKEAALVGYHTSHLGFPMGRIRYDIVTTEIRYHILMDILNLSGGTYALLPQQEAYFDKLDAK